MKRILFLASVAATSACLGPDSQELVELGAVTAIVDVNVGVPAQPFSTDEYRETLFLTLDYTAPGCPRLGDVDASLDAAVPDFVEPGGMQEATNHGSTERYCVKPAFYFEQLPVAGAHSTLRVRDGSEELLVDVAQLLVNPAITFDAPLRAGAPATALVPDGRAIAEATVWWRGEFDDPARVDWHVPADVTMRGELRFIVPASARGAGTIGFEVLMTEHELTCRGFARCDVTIRGGASFSRTTL